ncbi:hypothetical protein [Pilimelia columellifera]|uniref:Uncharacterized protein n=1 Tax=Pilimelia columellifera subsp. columellifera TaxID=706583 RepID=A0ABN3NR91_9ACTN
MLFALAWPVSFVGLLLGFVLAVVTRSAARRATARLVRAPVRPRGASWWRAEFDIFGVVAAAVAGPGWGRGVDLDHSGSRAQRVVPTLVGALSPLLLGAALLAGYRVAYGPPPLLLATDQLHGGPAPDYLAELLLSLAVELLCFGALALLPLPPLDGYALLWHAMRTPRVTAHKIRHVLVDNNVGPLILLFMSFFPLDRPMLRIPVDLIATPLLWALA